MRLLFLLGGFILLTLSQVHAQNQDSVAIKKYYEENAIYWLGWTTYYKNNQLFPLRDLKKEIILSPDAIYEFEKYKHNRTGLEISGAIGLGLFFSSFLVQDRQTKVGLLAGSAVALTISLPMSLSTGKHLSRAIWLHNRDVLLK